MRITINTTIDQDVGLESIHAGMQSNEPIDEFTLGLIMEFLNALKPTVEARRRELVKRSIDTVTDEKLTQIEALASP